MNHMKKLLISVTLAAAASAIVSAGCAKKQTLTPPPPPLRPEPLPPPPPEKPAKTDCDPSTPGDNLAAIEFKVREPRIQEAQKEADLAVADLQAAEGAELAPETREKFITDAVDGLLRALNADPYNVHATYNLAAAYARIKRTQCSLNMLERMLQMKDHHSRKVEVGKKLDRLLGRNSARLDPDFNDVRQDKRFSCLIDNMGAAQPVKCW